MQNDITFDSKLLFYLKIIPATEIYNKCTKKTDGTWQIWQDC